MKCLILILLLLPVYFSSAQNVGIGTNNPTQRLDVNGNVNVSGNILANGVSGGSGQVLMTNSQGVMTWGNVALGNSSGYDSVAVFQVGPSDCVGFSCPANNTFIITIPGNIDKIRIQAWGPGGIGVGTAANFSASGGGGGYVEAIVGGVGNKIMGIIVGENPNLNTALDVKTTWVAVNNLEFKALAGENASNDLTMIAMRGGEGGGFTVVNSNPGESSGRSWIGFKGQPGSDIQYRFDQINATTFARSMIGGNGGDGAMTMNTGGKGFYQYFNQTTNSPIAQARSYNGLTPGGGGGAPLYVFTDVNQTGGNGLVIISFAHSTVTNSTPPTPNNPPPDRSSNQQR